MLERLTPLERAVFLLHDVFELGYGEVAAAVGRSEATCRQLAVRARRHVEEERPRFEPSAEARDRLADGFFAAVEDGDLEGLELLTEDVVVVGDGGGTSPSWRHPIHGRDRVVRLLLGLGRHAHASGGTIRRVRVDGQPGAAVLDRDGRLMSVLALDVAGGAVFAVRSIINPGKLRHLGPLADVRAIMRERAGGDHAR